VADIPYGTALGAAQLNATSSVPGGSFSYSPPAGTVLTVPATGQYTLTATWTPPSGSTVSGGTITVPLTVYPLVPAIAWPAPADVPKGTTLGSAQLDASVSSTIKGTMTYSPPAGTVLAKVGPQILTATFTPTDNVDYATTTATNYVTVAEGTGTYDSGTVALAVNGSTIATASYGKGSTATSVAAALAAAASSSLVSVAAVDDALYIESKTAGAVSDYTYSLSAVSSQPSVFSEPSFAYPASSGTLGGGVASGADSGTVVYSYSVPTAGYDAVGNLLKYSDNSAKGPIMGTWGFSYDNLNRVSGGTDTQPGNPSADYCWSYDSFGNRTTQAGSNQPFATRFSGTPAANPCASASSASLANTSASYNALNRMAGSTQVPAGVPYDASGDVLNDRATAYLYDAEGRVCASANTPAPGYTTMTGYIYDADGLRVAKGTITRWSCDPGVSGFATVSDYVLGPGGEQVAEYGAGPASGGGALAWQHSNVWAAGKLLATYDKDGLHFYLDDPLGSRRVQTDFAGATEQTCASLPFGDALNCTGSTQFPTEHHFTGKERDAESGLDYLGARYYASSMGRFMSPDWADKPEAVPYSDLMNPQSLNLYSYVNNNPLSKADKDGHCPECMVWADEAIQYISDSPAGEAAGNLVMEGAAAGGALVGAILSGGGNAYPSYYHGEFQNTFSSSNQGGNQTPAPSAQPNSASPNPGPDGPYKRPNNATTQEQRDSVQGKPCATCGATGQKNNADHKDPLVVQHYRDGKVDKGAMRDPNAVQPQCQNCSNQQGGFLSNFSKQMKKLFGF
jgi:RHS repeat-associated protein